MGTRESATVRAAEEPDALADLQERIDILGAFTGGILFDFDREGRYLRVWTADPQLLARPSEELVGRTIAEVLGAVAGARFHEAVRTVFDSGHPASFEYTLDVPAGRRTFACEIRARDPRAARGPRTVTLLTRDVTVAKELEGKLVQAERLAALGLLAASVGHEIRQPLSYVLASLDVLERALTSASVAERAQSSLANIRSGAHRIAEIAASLDLLAGRRPRAIAPVEVRQPLQAAIDLCASQLGACAVERNIGDLPLVRGDESELSQVFANLLLNAVQARAPEERGAAHKVTITAGVVGDRVRVSVADSGVGIAAEHLPHVFDPFFTTKEKGHGTGLGLFISRGIVEAGGGQLVISSEPGQGTQVDVLLPIAAPAPLPKESTTALRRAPAIRKRLRVLLVDDEPRFLESLKLALEDDHTVEIQHEAAHALTILESDPTRYDVVICDLAMPQIDGAAFYERMGELGVADRFVLMTGGAYTSRAAEFVASKRCPTIPKPFLLERLLKLLDDVAGDR